MKAKCSLDGQWYWFVEKCLPFGSSISCRHFQNFSNSIAHIVTYFNRKDNVNYLDNYLFAALFKALCDSQVDTFLQICKEINFPVNLDKMFWGSTTLIFLGLLIDTFKQLVCIQTDKVQRAVDMIENILGRKKITVHELQKTCGLLNFLCRAVIPGRAFTRRLYAYISPKGANGVKKQLKLHHHISVTGEMKNDLTLWMTSLNHPSIFCRKFIDFDDPEYQNIEFFMDASRNFTLGFGGYCRSSWMMHSWDRFTGLVQLSIEHLELYAAVAAILAWIHRFKNKRVNVSVDNQSVMHMINETTSGCRNCMVLIRLLVLECLVHNVSVRAIYVSSKNNDIADALSRGQFRTFKKLISKRKMKMDTYGTKIPEKIWPIAKIWLN